MPGVRRLSSYVKFLISPAILAVALGGCAADHTPRAADLLSEARAAASAGDHARAAELLEPLAGDGGEAAVLLARARAGLARSRLALAPADPAALRATLDEVALALPLAGGDVALRGELLDAQAEAVALLVAEDARQLAGEAQAAAPPSDRPPAAEPPARPAAAPPVRPRPAAPAPPAAAQPAFAVVRRTSFDGSGNSGSFASCVDVQVVSGAGPVAGAVIGINNGDHSYQNQTDAAGYAGRCGLGASTWSVVLFWTPGEGGATGATTTVYLSGAPEQRAAVVFQGR